MIKTLVIVNSYLILAVGGSVELEEDTWAVVWTTCVEHPWDLSHWRHAVDRKTETLSTTRRCARIRNNRAELTWLWLKNPLETTARLFCTHWEVYLQTERDYRLILNMCTWAGLCIRRQTYLYELYTGLRLWSWTPDRPADTEPLRR